MTEYNNEPFLIGDFKHTFVEFMHISYQLWYTARPFPFLRRLFGYAVISRPGKVFILGGCCATDRLVESDTDWSIVSLFQNDKWSKVAYLRQGRMNFMALTYGTDIMIIGGKSRDNQP